MKILSKTGLLALACLAAFLFAVPALGALAQATASPTSDQYHGDLGNVVATPVPTPGPSPDSALAARHATQDSLDADDAVYDATTPSSTSPPPASPSPASSSSASGNTATPDGSDGLIAPPVTECPPSGVLPDGEKCTPATSDLAGDVAKDSRDADDAVDDASSPAASPSSGDSSFASPYYANPSSASSSSATGAAAPLEDEPPSAQAPSGAQGSARPAGPDDKGAGSGDSSEKAGEAKTGGGETVTGDETGVGDGPMPRLSVSEDDKFVEPVAAKRLDAKTLAEDEPKGAGFAALALMGGGSVLLAGMVAMGRLLQAPG